MLFEAATVLTEVDAALSAFSGAVWGEKRGYVHPESVNDKGVVWRRAQEKLEKTNGLVAVTCDQETYKAFVKFEVRVSQIERGQWTNPDTFMDSIDEYYALLAAARAAIRKELGMDDQRDNREAGGPRTSPLSEGT